MKKVAILQSNYIPWKGYFDLINSVDTFIFHDDRQYTKNDWRNRNKLKTSKGLRWLTIPAGTNEKRLIAEVEITNQEWKKRHSSLWLQHYRKAPYFEEYAKLLDYLYCNEITNLSDYNQRAIVCISQLLGIKTKFLDSREFIASEGKNERLISILNQAGATTYLSGPAAKSYLNEMLFNEAGIKVEWMNYAGYPEYPQFYPPFSHEVSILDLLFHTGPKAPDFMLTFSARNHSIS